MIIQRLFSKGSVQKEFNSKAAKDLLTNKYLPKVAAKNGIPRYESKGYRTVERLSRDRKNNWKTEARLEAREANPIFGDTSSTNISSQVNGSINTKSSYKGGRPLKSIDKFHYNSMKARKNSSASKKKLYYDHGNDKLTPEKAKEVMKKANRGAL